VGEEREKESDARVVREGMVYGALKKEF